MRFLGLLLRLYPASFRAEYGEDMRAVFAAEWRRAAGVGARIALLARAFRDALPSAFAAHADILGQDLRHSARSLGRSPGFTATAILVAALGIGAATAAFSITDHVLIRPLPYPESNRLVEIWESQPARGLTNNDVSPGNFRDWKRLATSFVGMGAYRNYTANLVGSGRPERVENAIVTAELFDVLRTPPALGRLFTAADDRPGAEGAVILSHRLWRERFGADPAVLGRRLLLDGAPHVVVGVMPRTFLFPRRVTDVWTTFRWDETAFEDRTDTFLTVVGRLKPGVSVKEAHAEMDVVARRLERAFPKANEGTGVDLYLLRDDLSGEARLLLLALFGAAVGVLLVACTNLASLLVARALARRAELGVRAAMGAGRERLVRQLLTESLLLSTAGGALGIAIAVAAAPLLARLIPQYLPIAETPPVDLRMLLFATLMIVATGLAFGILPARRACGEAQIAGLSEDVRSGSTRRTEKLRAVLLVVEVTASVALTISTGLLLRALDRVRSVDPGFRSEGVLTVRTSLPMPKYLERPPREALYTRVLSEVRSLPGVTGAAYITGLPMSMRGGIWPVAMGGAPEEREDNLLASLRFVTPGYFATLGVPIRLGRDVTDSDRFESPFVAVVSESFGRRYWPGENPLGKRFRFARHDRTIVGVAGDVRVRGLERVSEPQVYLPFLQVGDDVSTAYVPKDLAIRSTVSAATLLPSIRAIVEAADPELPLSDVRLLAEIVEADSAARSAQAWALGIFAGTALLLAGIGIYGLLAFTVSRRSREIGIRLALGAPRREILEMVLRQAGALAGAGALFGAIAAFAAGHGMKALLFGVSPVDLPTFLATGAFVVATALLGGLVPARRAALLDPISVIRAE
jgi:putative ABC transport system permease protein